MKKILIVISIIVSVIVTCSCSTTNSYYQRRYNALRKPNALVLVYVSTGDGEGYPNLIILKKVSRTFDDYSPTINGSTIGTWDIKGDTIICNYAFDYVVRKGIINTYIEPDSILTISNIQKRYLIKDKGDKILDITDYNILLRSIFADADTLLLKHTESYDPVEYKLLK